MGLFDALLYKVEERLLDLNMRVMSLVDWFGCTICINCYLYPGEGGGGGLDTGVTFCTGLF